MKILALDLGDVWIGTAISDPLGITCKPLQTVQFHSVLDFICEVVKKENVREIVVGLPCTLEGKESEQTKKTRNQVEILKSKIAEKTSLTIDWNWWDERKSSQQAGHIMRRNKASTSRRACKRMENKNHEHSVAAALILQGYLDRKAFMANS